MIHMSQDVIETLISAPDGAYAVDMDQTIVFWNSSAERILGHRAADVLGRSCHEVVCGVTADGDGKGCAKDCSPIVEARRGKLPPSRTMLATTSEGERKWITTTHLLLPGDRPDLSTFVHIFHQASEDVGFGEVARRLAELNSKEPGGGPPVNGEIRPLSPRERDVLVLLARGWSTDAIAKELVISPVTARNHIQHILTKMEVRNRLEAVIAAVRLSLV